VADVRRIGACLFVIIVINITGTQTSARVAGGRRAGVRHPRKPMPTA
jgi:hypothetical protein